MKKIVLVLAWIAFYSLSYAQEQQYNWAFGIYGDVQLKSPKYYSNIGLQAKYDVDNHNAFQVQVLGRSNFVAVGADYLFSVLNKSKNNFNVFLGPGIEQNFTWDRNDDGIMEPNTSANFFNVTGQLGVSYAFPDVRLSLFSSLKVKYNTKLDEVEPNYLSIGVRYHLW